MWWVVTEVGGTNFGDARLTQRLIQLLDCLSERPDTSIPQACESWAMTKASSRFFANPRVTPAAIVAAHRRTTVHRVAQYPVILAVQDTTTLNCTLHRHTQGVGPIGQAGLSGFFLHSCLAVSPEGVPLGLLGGMTWVRPPESQDSHRTHQHRPLADKESRRWIDLMDAATADLPPTTRVIMVADREADLIDVVVRAAWDRRCVEPAGYLWVTVPRHDDAPGRPAVVPLRSARVTLRPPRGAPGSSYGHRRVGAGGAPAGGHAAH